MLDDTLCHIRNLFVLLQDLQIKYSLLWVICGTLLYPYFFYILMSEVFKTKYNTQAQKALMHIPYMSVSVCVCPTWQFYYTWKGFKNLFSWTERNLVSNFEWDIWSKIYGAMQIYGVWWRCDNFHKDIDIIKKNRNK